MDFMTILIIVVVLLSAAGGIVWYVLAFLVGRAVLRGIAGSLGEFQRMDIDGMYRTLLHLQKTGQMQLGRRYMDSVEGPLTTEIRGMAASEGITLDF